MFIEAQSDPVYPKEDYKAREHQLRTALLKAQYERLNRADRSLLIVVAGIDGAGKGQTINQLNDWMDPRHIHTAAFGEPDEIEAQFPPLWRYWNAIPAKGQTGIVFGSWYSQLLRECYRKKTRPDRIEGIGAQIRRFEAMLTAEGVQIVKLWYHLSAKAQVERIERLTSSPETSWQVSPDDYRVAKRYDRLCDAANIALALTDQDHAPWVVIPSADDNMRVIRTAETVLATMKRRAIPIVARAAMDRPRLGPVPDRLGDLDYDAHEDKHDYERELGLLQGRLAQAVRSEKFQKRSLILAFEARTQRAKAVPFSASCKPWTRAVTTSHPLQPRPLTNRPAPIFGVSGARCRAAAVSRFLTGPGMAGCWSSAWKSSRRRACGGAPTARSTTLNASSSRTAPSC